MTRRRTYFSLRTFADAVISGLVLMGDGQVSDAAATTESKTPAIPVQTITSTLPFGNVDVHAVIVTRGPTICTR